MTESLVNFFIDIFSGINSSKLGKEICVFVISMMPILELRGGLIAASLLKLNPWASYAISIIGNMLPVPFILWFVESIINFFRRKKILIKFVNWIDRKVEKNKHSIEKCGFWGLVFFVGIPLPGTGAWTGCLIASFLKLDRKKSFLATFIGVVMASIIMMIISFGILSKLI